MNPRMFGQLSKKTILLPVYRYRHGKGDMLHKKSIKHLVTCVVSYKYYSCMALHVFIPKYFCLIPYTVWCTTDKNTSFIRHTHRPGIYTRVECRV